MKSICIALLLAGLVFAMSAKAEETAPPPLPLPQAGERALPVRVPKKNTDGRKLLDQSVFSTAIGSEQASSGMVLTADGKGGATWASALMTTFVGNVTGNVTGNVSGSAGSFTGSLAGDVTGTQGATVVSKVGSVTAANVVSAVNIANSATTAATANTVVLRDANGNIPGAVVGAVVLAGDVSGQSGTTVVNKVGGAAASDIAIAANLSKTATATAGVPNSVVLRDSSGNIAGAAVSGVVLAGDVSGASGVNTVDKVGGVTAANIVAGVNLANAATNVNTANTLVKRDGSGSFAGGTFTGNVTGNVSGSAASFTGPLVGDVTGTQGATVVAKVGGVAAATIANAMGNATSANTPNTLVLRDANGSFSAGGIGIGTNAPATPLLDVTAAGESDIFSTSFGGIISGVPSFAGRSARGTAAAPTAALSGDTLAIFGGRGFGASAFVTGSKAGMQLLASENWSNSANGSVVSLFSTANTTTIATERMRIDHNGNVGIGTSAPAQKLHVQGNVFLGGQDPTIVGIDLQPNARLGFIKLVNFSPMLASSSGEPLIFGQGNGLGVFASSSVTERMRIDASGNIGIGTSFPASLLELSSNGSSEILNTCYGTGTLSAFVGRKARGTAAAPTAVQSGDLLALFGGKGYTGLGFTSSSRAGMQLLATENWSTTSNGSVVSFFSTANATTTATERMRIDQNGRVGIGTTAPASLLELSVNGSPEIMNTSYGGFNNNCAFIGRSARGTAAAPTATGSGDYLAYFSGRGYTGSGFTSSSKAGVILVASESWTTTNNGSAIIFVNTPNGSTTTTERMRIDQNGNVSIGTYPNPALATFSVYGGVGRGISNVPQFGYFSTNGAATGTFDGGGFTSIYSQYGVTAEAYIAISDERIKNITGRSDSAKDLNTLLGIEITDYRFKDSIGRGNSPQKKVIAQQVEKVYPQVVNRSTDVVPDIYKKAEHKDGWVKLATTLKKGDRVRLISEKEQSVHEVLEVKDGEFRTAFKPEDKDVFVYGREVNDFRSVDYEAISMLNVSATQELAKQVAALKDENSELKKRVAELEAKDKARDARLARIEKTFNGDKPQALPAAFEVK